MCLSNITDKNIIEIIKPSRCILQPNPVLKMASGGGGKRTSSSKPSMLDLEKQFTFYASYHNNPVNILIHLLCIWNIAASAIVMLQFTPALAAMPHWVQDNVSSDLKLNTALIVCTFYSAGTRFTKLNWG
jgi:hypothetical protein